MRMFDFVSRLSGIDVMLLRYSNQCGEIDIDLVWLDREKQQSHFNKATLIQNTPKGEHDNETIPHKITEQGYAYGCLTGIKSDITRRAEDLFSSKAVSKGELQARKRIQDVQITQVRQKRKSKTLETNFLKNKKIKTLENTKKGDVAKESDIAFVNDLCYFSK